MSTGGTTWLLRVASLKDWKPVFEKPGWMEWRQHTRCRNDIESLSADIQTAVGSRSFLLLICIVKEACFYLDSAMRGCVKKCFHHEYVFIMNALGTCGIVFTCLQSHQFRSAWASCVVSCATFKWSENYIDLTQIVIVSMGLKCVLTLIGTSSWPITKPTQPTEYVLK